MLVRSPNLKNGKGFITMDCSSSGVFMMNNTPSGAKKHRKSMEASQMYQTRKSPDSQNEI